MYECMYVSMYVYVCVVSSYISEEPIKKTEKQKTKLFIKYFQIKYFLCVVLPSHNRYTQYNIY